MNAQHPQKHYLRSPRRAATAGISGYSYQFAHTALHWLRCRANETIICEGNEDLDRAFEDGSVEEIQLKHIAGSLSARSAIIRDTVSRFADAFCEHQQRGRRCRLIFTTTAMLTGTCQSALQKWISGKRFDKAKLVLEVQGELQLSNATRSFLEKNNQWSEFLASIRWNLGAPKLDEKREELLQSIAADDRSFGLDPLIVASTMLTTVLQKSGQKELAQRTLTRGDLAFLLNDLWLSKGVAEYGVMGTDETVYITMAEESGGDGITAVAVIIDDVARAQSEFNAACEFERHRPRGKDVDSLSALSELDGGRFLANLGFDVYSIVDLRSPKVGRDLVLELLPYVSARGISEARLVGGARAKPGGHPDVDIRLIPESTTPLGAAVAVMVAEALLRSWRNRTFDVVIAAIHSKLRVVCDLAERSYFTQSESPPWASA